MEPHLTVVAPLPPSPASSSPPLRLASSDFWVESSWLLSGNQQAWLEPVAVGVSGSQVPENHTVSAPSNQLLPQLPHYIPGEML